MSKTRYEEIRNHNHLVDPKPRSRRKLYSNRHNAKFNPPKALPLHPPSSLPLVHGVGRKGFAVFVTTPNGFGIVVIVTLLIIGFIAFWLTINEYDTSRRWWL